VDRSVSWLAGAGGADAVERALAEIDAAITMVAFGVARSVRLCNLPGAEEAAFDAAARAQAADVAFSLQRHGSRSVTMIIGPRLPDGSRPGSRPASGDEPDPSVPA
jgi:hypothetical protein